MDTESVIHAIADPSRRRILDALRSRDGQSVGELTEALAPLGRHAVLKHVGVLETAGLIVSRKEGRVRRCHLNPVPIVQLAERWIDDFGARASAGLLALKNDLEKGTN
ncbi:MULTISPECIES: metalloregulator ArsR/SmtB family transcription factor [unclassified Microbacterium]|uniref:ArsR/SmtB family transcription factor n=1 Tax=unclassified Microbacterium TaxID=2609290 RepID=UPI00214B1296|nr:MULTISPECIES: metalloregulator ArsR/SmtB family transcription factor [unclassified Microbacterium]MCR2810536.1 metalloregulator ArsR/SmtB family transcription factor [Microbacterium sp. zg.B185]WIM19522.1 metalloregulator ArsR/SmtB family transcription factor [Microbacterium sp. zg-B185]